MSCPATRTPLQDSDPIGWRAETAERQRRSSLAPAWCCGPGNTPATLRAKELSPARSEWPAYAPFSGIRQVFHAALLQRHRALSAHALCCPRLPALAPACRRSSNLQHEFREHIGFPYWKWFRLDRLCSRCVRKDHARVQGSISHQVICPSVAASAECVAPKLSLKTATARVARRDLAEAYRQRPRRRFCL